MGFIETLLVDPFVISTIIVGLITFYVTSFYWKVRKYPPGPFPIPVLGNTLLLRKSSTYHEAFYNWSKLYGDPFTVWIGSRPTVVVNSPRNLAECHAGSKRNHFGGRTQLRITQYDTGGIDDIFWNSMGETWDAMRKVAIRGVRTYAVSEHVERICADITDATLAEVADSKTPASLQVTVDNIMQDIMGVTAFGFQFDKTDPDLIKFRKSMQDLNLAQSGLPSDITPILGLIWFRKERFVKDTLFEFNRAIYVWCDKACQGYEPGKIRHFMDAMMQARDEALEEERSIAKHLTEKNLYRIVVVLFGAGVIGSAIALRWSFLYLAKYPDAQERLRQEVMSVLGDSRATLQDRDRLPLVSSFLLEILRMFLPTPIALLHETPCDTELNGRKIPRGTSVSFNLWAQHHDSDVWGPDHDKFVLDRFVRNGKFMAKKQPEFATFGVGPRACPGERLAHADIFFVLVKTLQKYRIVASNGPENIDLTPNTEVVFATEVKEGVTFKVERLQSV